MNSSVRKYVNKLGMLYKKYLPDSNLFGVRMFALIDEYYFNDKLVDTSYSVGLNVGRFKSQISSRAQVEITLYLKDTLKIVDNIVLLVQNKQEYFEYSKKSEYRVNYNDVVLDVEAIFAMKKINDNEYRLGVVYKSQTGEIIDSVIVTLDYYDVIEFHNLLKSFTQTSYNFIINLATHQHFKLESVEYRTTNQSEIIDKGISSIVVNAEPIDDEVLKSFEEESTLELNLPIKNLKITTDNVVNNNKDSDDTYDNNVTQNSNQYNIEDEENCNNPKEEKNNQDSSNDILDDMKDIMLGDDFDEESNDDKSINVDDIKLHPGVKEFLENIKQYGCKYSFKDGIPVIEEITPDIKQSFYDLLKNYINMVNNFRLSSVQLKPGFKLMFLTLPIKEFVLSNKLVNKGLFDILQALYIIKRAKSDEPLFGKFNDEMIEEKIELGLKKHEQLINDFKLYKELFNKNF